jgi:apolipoprotein N-acyltransferase
MVAHLVPLVHAGDAPVTGCPFVERPHPLPIALGLVAGLLICAALPPWGWWPLAPVGIALWLHLLDEPSRLQRFAVGWAVGVAWFGPSTLWMWELTQPGYVVGLLLGWGPMVGAVGVMTPGDRRRLIALPAAIVLFEWFHSHAPFGGVPLSMVAMSQTRAPLLPVATVGGVLVLSAAVAVLGVALYLAATERRWKEPLAVVVGVGALAGLGALWPAGAQVGEVRAAIVQGGGPQGTRFSSAEAPLVFERHMEATRSIDADEDVDLVLWPENAINVDGAFADSPWGAELAAEAVRLGATVLVGIVEDAPDDPDAFLNYVLTFEPDGTVGARYDKERRVPFGEYVPMRPLFEPVAAGVLPPRDQVPGDGSAAIRTDAGPFAVAISWEVFFARRVREGVREGGEVVLNPTNGSSYWLTQVQTQQLATSALRAAESGRWLLQAAPTGFSAVFDDDGTVLAQTQISERAVLFVDVPRLSGTTPAQALGDVPALTLSAAALLLVGRPGWPRRRDQVRSAERSE